MHFFFSSEYISEWSSVKLLTPATMPEGMCQSLWLHVVSPVILGELLAAKYWVVGVGVEVVRLLLSTLPPHVTR